MDQYLSTRDAAKFLGVSYSTLMSWIYKRRLPARRAFGRWIVARRDVQVFKRGKKK